MAKKTKEKTKPQKPPKEPKQKKTKDARYSKRRKGLFFALLATLLIAVSVVGACTVFFQVETVTVTGNERYSEQQILDVASVEMGANMILTPSEQIAQRTGRGGRETAALNELAKLLGMDTPPVYIEAYDISNLAGSENVAGMVVFEDGRPLRSAYRKFKIRSVSGQDDYGSMQEVITRRFAEYEKEKSSNEGFGRMPDLILLDGGRGHVAAILPLIRELGYSVPVFGMVKDDHHRTRAIAIDGGEIAIRSNRSAFTLVSSIQEEVHRFAIGFHRQSRSKATFSSSLEAVPGIGKTRVASLLRHFHTMTAIRNATEEELCMAPGMNRPAAESLYRHLHPAADEAQSGDKG